MKNLGSKCIEFFKKIILETKEGNLFIFFFLVLFTIPLSHLVNSISLVLLLMFALINSKREFLNTNRLFYLFILFYAWMCFSMFWTFDKNATYKSLSKEICFVLIPFVIFISKPLSKDLVNKIVKHFSYSILFYSIYFIILALLKYFNNNNFEQFFYHELVSKDLNAVHFSVFVSFSLLYFFTKITQTIYTILIQLFLFVFLVLLQSKIILITTVILIVLHLFFYSKIANRMRLRNLLIVGFLLLISVFYNTIKERLEFEFKVNSESSIGHTVINKEAVGSKVISMKEAWENQKFNQTDFFSGTSFRVYQTRLFFEILNEENVFWQGLGLNASYKSIENKSLKYNVYRGNEQIEGYQKKNFHNQYIQVFAELGFIGFVIFMLILFVNTKNAFKSKDFMHITFAILMISVFLTESFLWRQRGVVFFTVFYGLFNSFHFSNNKA